MDNMPLGWGLLAGGAALGLLAACWRYIQGVLMWLLGFLVVRVRLQSELGLTAAYHFSRQPHYRSSFRHFLVSPRWSQRHKKNRSVLFECFGAAPRLRWHGWAPVLLTFSGDCANRDTHLAFIRGTINVEKLVKDLETQLNDLLERACGTSSRFYVVTVQGEMIYRINRSNSAGQLKDIDPRRPSTAPNGSETPQLSGSYDSWSERTFRSNIPVGYTYEELEYPREPARLSYLSLTEDVLDMVAEARRWLDSKDWYLQRQIPWRHGWLLTGKPGTGKSSLVQAIACSFDLPVICFDLATLTNVELVREWGNKINEAPCIFLFEDFDAVFQGRDNVTGAEGGVTFDCLLNCISGVRNSDGVFVIITTNDADSLDAALADTRAGERASRPGRIDRVLHLPDTLEEDGRRKMAERIMHGLPVDLIDGAVAAGVRDTGAQFQFRCQQIALKWFWADGYADRVC